MNFSKIAAQNDEVPVGAVIVKDGKIIAEGYNLKEKENCAIFHAEMVAIYNASKYLDNWWLEDCELYVTLEPCLMCVGALVHSRISKVYFGAYDYKTGACESKFNLLEKGLHNVNIEYEGGILQSECSKILSNFFQTKKKNLKLINSLLT